MELTRAKEGGQRDAPRDDAEYWMDNTNISIASISISIARRNNCNGEITKTIRFNIHNGQTKLARCNIYTG
eukprot:COSAG02_NODE_3766_length_6268_cov_9.545145_8_plen_71_part_00